MQSITSLEELRAIPVNVRARWYIPESISTAYPIEERGEPLVDLKDVCLAAAMPIVLDPVAPQQVPKLAARSRVALRLIEAIRMLRERYTDQYTIKVRDAYRPLALQQRYFDEISAEIHAKEGLEGRALWERVTQFIADPALCPPHTTGGAIDCTIVDLGSSAELWMGTPIDAIDDKAETFHPGIDADARAHREMLFSVMTAAGFVNLASEWWHYSYGDQYWAAFTNAPHAHYGNRSIPQQ